MLLSRPISRSRLRRLADEELMRLASEGDAEAFQVVYERHADSAYALAYRMCGRKGAAEDVVQEAFVSLWRASARYDRERGSLRTFLLGIVHNRSIDALRRATVDERGRAPVEGVPETVASADRTEAEVARRDEARGVRAALRTLPADQARVIELAYFGGFSQSEIASMLGAPLGTVKGRMRLALEKLRTELTEVPA
jgi:RNA polymerase sigma-70 factor (ECF subfamily)